jgi:hypothetical protein
MLTRAALILGAVFGLSMRFHLSSLQHYAHLILDRSFINLPVLGVPASIAFGYVVSMASTRKANIRSFGAVYMICAVGVYV